MKKLFCCLLSAFTFLYFTCGCTAQTTANQSESDAAQSSVKISSTPEATAPAAEADTAPESQTAEVYNMSDTAVLGDWNISVTDAQIVDSIQGDFGSFSPDGDGNKYLQVFVSVSNNGKEAARFLPSVGIGDDVNAKVLYGDGYEFSATGLLGYSNDLHDSSINPLSSKTGEIAFNVPATVADSTDELLIQFTSGSSMVSFEIR